MTKDETHNDTKSSKNPLPWIAGAVLILGMAIVGGLYWSANMTVEQVRFEGNYFVSSDELEKVEVPTGINPDSLDYADIRRQFEQLPYVRRADISVEPNGELLVDITERKPIALLAEGTTKVYVDHEGIRLPKVLGKTVDVPILYGFSATPLGDTLNSKAFEYASNFLKTVHNKNVSNATISEVAWTKKEGIVALTNQNGVKLIFGKGDYANRLRNWEAFYGKVIKQKGIKAMRSVDLRFQGQIVTREKET
ncbi:cell division protein FtsQ/DivIB [Fodinibius halophilus]|uniref:FtsQ-type POTRA domain-containing protein n=1 Tax=Fodinibius halophilus TaxID=1736908 RepID=A0A6M1TAH9_9BACT|nr:FtsQ-type POTRA domain-containing protein [Fodinibius halophilus]NGP89423.1 FtsQ-type POTRA domain-containing protein [Fodinibius halophilus]